MGSDIDVLIIFAYNDNETAKSELGWVSQFKKFLEFMLIQVTGETPNIMLKSEHDVMVSPQLNNAAVLITILSKSFMHSLQCLYNLEAFSKVVDASLKNRNRILKVFKTPLTPPEQPKRLRELVGYEMYQIDPASAETKNLDYLSAGADPQYWMKIADLANDISETLLYLDDRPITPKVKTISTRKTIYLAETSHDLFIERNIIKRELQRSGYIVLPDQTLPSNITDLERLVKSNLEESNLSIHLIGTSYGEIPNGSELSVVDLQNKFAAAKSLQSREANEEYTRLIWISPSLNSASERQKAFIENIKLNIDGQEGAEILQNELEDFKNIIREELIGLNDKKVLEDVGCAIYLMHDRVDSHEVLPFVELIQKSGFKVLMPEFNGELLELREKHIDSLRNFDAAVIYKGKVNEQWVRMKALDLLKAPGFGRRKPIKGKAIVTAAGSKMNMDSFKNQNIRIIEGNAENCVESLKMFLQGLNP